MKNSYLLKKVKRLGFALMEPEEPFDANEVLAEVVKSRDIRLWEGFPVLVLNAAARGLFNYESASNLLRTNRERTVFTELLLFSLALYKYLRLKYSWTDKLYAELPQKDMDPATAGRRHSDFYKCFKDNRDFVIAKSSRMNPGRIKNNFNNYLKGRDLKIIDSQRGYETLSLEYAQSQIFSPKQKDLFLKKLNGEKLNKTEREYFSRVVKKKAAALANPELHRLARKVLKH
ncbi:MAG: hypothetical protein ABIH68_03345 [bacterium]